MTSKHARAAEVGVIHDGHFKIVKRDNLFLLFYSASTLRVAVPNYLSFARKERLVAFLRRKDFAIDLAKINAAIQIAEYGVDGFINQLTRLSEKQLRKYRLVYPDYE